MGSSRKVTKAEQSAEQQRIAALEAQLAALLAKQNGREPGWHDLGKDDYCDAKFQRMIGGETGEITFNVKADFVGCFPNLRFHKGRPIPGFGGDRERWIGKDGKGGLLAYFRSKEFAADLFAMIERAEKTKAKAKAKA